MPRKLWSIYLTLTLALLFSSAIANPLGRVALVSLVDFGPKVELETILSV